MLNALDFSHSFNFYNFCWYSNLAISILILISNFFSPQFDHTNWTWIDLVFNFNVHYTGFWHLKISIHQSLIFFTCQFLLLFYWFVCIFPLMGLNLVIEIDFNIHIRVKKKWSKNGRKMPKNSLKNVNTLNTETRSFQFFSF